jgi:GH24 family phage-related lysozyme (muramidase)
MIDDARLQQEIIDHEGGIILKPYKDHLGNWTISAGHLIKEREMNEFRDGITYEIGLKLFLVDYMIAKRDMQTFLKPCGDMPAIVQEVCLEMAFQIGLPKLEKFVKFKQALSDENWKEAIAQMKDSRWYQQTPNRATALMKKMKKLISENIEKE